MSKKVAFFVYMVECSDKTYYTGFATDVTRRVKEHNGLSRGAKYTRIRRPVRLVYTFAFTSRTDAMRREREIKKMTRKQKMDLLTQLQT